MFRALQFLLCIILLTTTLAGCDKAEKSTTITTAELKRAENYFAQGQFKAAVIEVKNAIKANNKSLDAYLLLARIYFEQGNYLQSVKVLKQLPQDNLDVITLLGKNYLYEGKYKSLQETLEPLQQNSAAATSWDYQHLLTASAIMLDDFSTADSRLQHLETLADTNQRKAQLEVLRAHYYAERKQPDQELAALNKALGLVPNDIDALTAKARYQLERKDYEHAEDLLSQALMALPTTDTMTLQRLAILQAMVTTLTHEGRSSEALVYSKLIAEANPKAQEIQTEFQSAVDQLKDGDIKKAESILNKLYLNDNARTAGSLLGLIHFQQGDFADAAQLFTDTIDPETASPQILRAFAESQLRLNNPEEALKIIQANVHKHPNNPDILSVYGLSLLATGQVEKGIENLQSALKLDPTRARLRLALVDAFNKEGQQEKALSELEQAFKSDKKDTVIQERLLRQYRLMHKDTELTNLINELAAMPAVQSRTLAGLALLGSDPKRASALLDAAYRDSPTDPAVLRGQVARYIMAKEPDQVIRYAKELVSLNHDDLFALASILQARESQKRSGEAVRYLQDLAKDSANTWGPDYMLALYYFRANDLDKATHHIDTALTRSSFNNTTTTLYTRIYLNRAIQFAAEHDYAHARETVMDALQNAPSNVQLMHLLVNIELAEQHITEAEKVVQEIEQTAPKSYVALFAEGDLAKAKGDMDKARSDYEQAWQLHATDQLGNAIWGMMSKNSSSAREAFIADWKKKLPYSFQVFTIEGLYQQGNGNNQAAESAYNTSLARNPRQPAVLNNLAWLTMESGDLDKALALVKSAFELDPENPNILDSYGWIAYKAGDKSLALTKLEKASSLLPDNADIKAHLNTVKNAN